MRCQNKVMLERRSRQRKIRQKKTCSARRFGTPKAGSFPTNNERQNQDVISCNYYNCFIYLSSSQS